MPLGWRQHSLLLDAVVARTKLHPLVVYFHEWQPHSTATNNYTIFVIEIAIGWRWAQPFHWQYRHSLTKHNFSMLHQSVVCWAEESIRAFAGLGWFRFIFNPLRSTENMNRTPCFWFIIFHTLVQIMKFVEMLTLRLVCWLISYTSGNIVMCCNQETAAVVVEGDTHHEKRTLPVNYGQVSCCLAVKNMLEVLCHIHELCDTVLMYRLKTNFKDKLSIKTLFLNVD